MSIKNSTKGAVFSKSSELDIPKEIDAPKGEIKVRERLLSEGVQSLSDRELLVAILGSGCAGKSVVRLADDVLRAVDQERAQMNTDIAKGIIGIGDARACSIAAALELGRRYYSVQGKRIAMPQDIYPLIAHFADRKQEHFLCISLNGAHEVNAIRQITTGLVNKTVVHPREMFADPIVDRACAIIVAHNHPSGNLEPSREDVDITKRLREVGEMLGIPLLDHLVFSNEAFYSFVEHGLITPPVND